MRFEIIATISLLIFVNGIQANACPSNCASCGLKDGSSDQFCFVCGYGKQWVNGACDAKLSDVNCAFHSAAGCLGCVQGWYLNMDTQKCEQVGSPIKSCYAGGSNPSGIKKIGGPLRYTKSFSEEQKYLQTPTVTCNVCDGFYPDATLATCSGPLIPGDNCQWGALDDYGKSHCMKCKSGYVSQVGVCKQISAPGCIYTNASGQCVQCSQGYFMKYSGVCAINNSEATVSM